MREVEMFARLPGRWRVSLSLTRSPIPHSPVFPVAVETLWGLEQWPPWCARENPDLFCDGANMEAEEEAVQLWTVGPKDHDCRSSWPHLRGWSQPLPDLPLDSVVTWPYKSPVSLAFIGFLEQVLIGGRSGWRAVGWAWIWTETQMSSNPAMAARH